jgi:hypothetical protein
MLVTKLAIILCKQTRCVIFSAELQKHFRRHLTEEEEASHLRLFFLTLTEASVGFSSRPQHSHHQQQQEQVLPPNRLSTMPMPGRNRKLPQNSTPASFICPLTTQLMEDPVMDLCAHNFERAAITEWLSSKATHECCPISRKPLTLDDLVPNHTLAERIDKWQWHQENDGIMFIEETKMSESYSDDDDDDDDSVDIESAKIGILRESGSLSPARTDSDLEMVAGQDKRQSRASGKKNNNNKYGPVPVEFMLLPQERRVLQIVRLRAQEHREKRRRSTLCNTFMGVSVVVFLVFLSLTLRKFLTAE